MTQRKGVPLAPIATLEGGRGLGVCQAPRFRSGLR